MRLLLAALPVLIAMLATATPAAAYDPYPCSKEITVPWSPTPVQTCPLTDPTGPKEGIPVYKEPVAVASGKTPPTPVGWIYGTEGKDFVCDLQFPNATFYHPTSGAYNNWWAYTRASSNYSVWGWTPEVYFKGGGNDEPDGALRTCPSATPPAPTPPPSEPAPPAPPAPPPPPPPGPCSRTPASASAKVKVSFKNNRRISTVPFHSHPLVKGTIVAADGAAMAGASLCVGVQPGATGRVKAVDSVSADANGHFSFRLGHGVSRRIWLVHRDGGGAAIGSLLVRVRAPLALGADRLQLHNGQAVKLKGRLEAKPSAGLLIEMQALRGKHWQTFATTKTKPSGGFNYRYRFTRTYGLQTYKLRARIEKQPGSPFATGASKPVTVKVKG